jgi:translation initiation factor 1
VDGLRFPDEEIKNIAKILKKQCGSGGSIKGGKIEIQGDVRDEILPTLQKMGLIVKKAGG